jgi:hypothetical protein
MLKKLVRNQVPRNRHDGKSTGLEAGEKSAS